MTYLKNFTKAFIVLLVFTIISCKSPYPNLEDGIYAEFITTKGTMVAKLAYDKVPVTVANFVSLAEGSNTMVESIHKGKKFYNGLIFHRVIDKFMIQGGDPLGNGFGNPGYKFNDEFHSDLKHDKPGVLSMANSGRNTNGSQFFITEVPKPNLDNKHAVFGELVLGIDIQDSISNVDVGNTLKPTESVIIHELNIIRKGRDAKKFDAPKIFNNHFAEIERKEKERLEKIETAKNAAVEKFKKQRETVIKLPSGLEYTITQKGNGEKLKATDKVKTEYAVYFEDGKLLDASKLETAEAMEAVNPRKKATNGYQPITADLSPDAVMISGFKEGLQQLHVGDKATLFIPYHLAYGETEGRGIPPKSNLIFEVEILEIIK